MNHHPLHINDVYAAESQQGRNVVVGPLVYSLALGMSVADVSGKAIANLATDELSHPAPVFHGDTLFAESEVLEVKPSQSKPDRGVVRVHTRVFKQDGTLVAEFKRAVLVPRRNRAGDKRNRAQRPSGRLRPGEAAPAPYSSSPTRRARSAGTRPMSAMPAAAAAEPARPRPLARVSRPWSPLAKRCL
jgi:acyl dehydratase